MRRSFKLMLVLVMVSVPAILFVIDNWEHLKKKLDNDSIEKLITQPTFSFKR
ncbi:MAG TPA: hypothetical protein PK191_08760 [Niabella sp.]|nr:hypothetical protein [Niabella sp.]HOZ98096.1 hypothetical protein [Niabella sp.]HRB36921.1 hypothetical protein [Niabella sp.]HRB44079.1 hypothetical protein [Niabella sp.]HRB49917.1 hypothetical protein [Niabella sp.]